MMTKPQVKIDWSKAPEGATHYFPETDQLYAAWYKKVDSGWMIWVVDVSNKWEHSVRLSLPNAIARPAEFNDVPLIRLSDYERLQAECDHYKSATVEITARHFTERWVNAASDKELEQYLSDGIAQLEFEYRKQIEALLAECEKLRRRARAAEREYSKVARTLKGLERVSKVVSDHSDEVCTENNQLRVECKKLRKLVSECSDYLSHNEHTCISHGSVLHSKLIDAAMEKDHGNQ